MGKDKKKKKFGASKPQPTGLPSMRESEAELEAVGNVIGGTSQANIQALIERLQSPHEETRECACTTVAGLVSEAGAIGSLMKLNIVKVLAPLVLDPSWDIRHRALGALRNLSVEGDAAICEQMVQSDVLTPLLVFIKQYSVPDQPVEAGERTNQRLIDSIQEAYTHAFYLLLYLCESSPIAVQTFTKEGLLTVLCFILKSEHTTDSLKIAIGEFLHTVTEENGELCRPELVECVQQIMSATTQSSSGVLMKILATGVLVNLEGSKLSSAKGDLVVPIVTAVAEVLTINTAALLLEMNCPENGTSTEMAEEGDGDGVDKACGKIDEKIQDLENLLKAQKVALEITANLCCTDDEEWVEMENSDCSSEEGADVAMDNEEMIEDSAEGSLSVSTELHAAYTSCGIVTKVLETAQPLSPEQSLRLEALPENSANLTKRFLSKQTSALLCINNLVSGLDDEALGGVERLHNVWQGLTQLSTSQNSIQSEELLEAATSAMRAVIHKLAQLDPAKFENVTPADFQFTYEMATKCQWSEVRVNALRIVSTIGGILARNKSPHPLLKDIGAFLLEIIFKDADLHVVAEALDATFDVFAEDHVDPVVKEIGLVEKLKSIIPELKNKIRTNKKSLGEHYPVIMMAKTNLLRFIKYKSSN